LNNNIGGRDHARRIIVRSGEKKEDNSVSHERGYLKEDVIWLEIDF
jgi:hypothetical protein